jgi:hypothetical protein
MPPPVMSGVQRAHSEMAPVKASSVVQSSYKLTPAQAALDMPEPPVNIRSASAGHVVRPDGNLFGYRTRKPNVQSGMQMFTSAALEKLGNLEADEGGEMEEEMENCNEIPHLDVVIGELTASIVTYPDIVHRLGSTESGGGSPSKSDVSGGAAVGAPGSELMAECSACMDQLPFAQMTYACTNLGCTGCLCQGCLYRLVFTLGRAQTVDNIWILSFLFNPYCTIPATKLNNKALGLITITLLLGRQNCVAFCPKSGGIAVLLQSYQYFGFLL